MAQGWVSIHRQLNDNWLWKDKPFSKGQAWIDILLRVNHKSAKVPVGNQIIEVEPGQTIWSVKDMSEKWGWSRKKVDNFLNILQTELQITKKSTTKYTLLTVEKWELYQTEEQQKNINGTSKEHQKNTNNNDNNKNNEKIKDIVDYLNKKTGKSFKATTKKTKDCIIARINEGYEDVKDFHKVIDIKASKWIGTDNEMYLRPETLFGNKFEGYLNEKPKQQTKSDTLKGAEGSNTLGKRQPDALQ